MKGDISLRFSIFHFFLKGRILHCCAFMRSIPGQNIVSSSAHSFVLVRPSAGLFSERDQPSLDISFLS